MWPCPNRLVSGNFCTVKTRNKRPEEGHRQAGALLDFMRPIRDSASKQRLSFRSIDYASNRCFMRPIKLYASNPCFMRPIKLYASNPYFRRKYKGRAPVGLGLGLTLKICLDGVDLKKATDQLVPSCPFFSTYCQSIFISPMHYFSGHCIPQWKLCDGSNDCSDGADEKTCCWYIISLIANVRLFSKQSVHIARLSIRLQSITSRYA
jgi:hypothetical protein